MPPPCAVQSPPLLPWALLLAAGSGTRMGQGADGPPKQFLPHAGAPLYWASALTLGRAGCIGGIVFVFPHDCLEAQQCLVQTLAAGNRLGLPWLAIAGGERRQDSVYNGLRALPPEVTHVLVHDAARPFVSAALVNRVVRHLEAGARAVIPGVPVNDTIKLVRDGLVRQTLERDALVAVQTPQGFARRELVVAHERCRAEGWAVTDDASLLEKCGVPVMLTPGEAGNVKITRPEDRLLLQAHPHQPTLRLGHGYDVHRFATGETGGAQAARPLRLGGVPIPGGPDVLAHSDGDVLLHALMDALLGCAGAGDMGEHFPDTDPRFAGVDSAVLLDDVLRLLTARGVRVLQADVTIITQIPRIAPHRKAIGRRLGALLGLAADCVNVKATTEEGLGFTGALQGIKAVAVVLARHTPTRESFAPLVEQPW